MAKEKQISIRITTDQFNTLNKYGNTAKGIEALVDLTHAIGEWVLTSIRKQNFTREEINVLADPLAMRVSQSLDDKTVDHLCKKYNASPDSIKNKLSALHPVERIFLAEEFKHHDVKILLERFQVIK